MLPRLSEAIRAGAMLHPQAFGTMREVQSDGSVRTCALGAAYEVIGRDVAMDSPHEWLGVLIAIELAPCPCFDPDHRTQWCGSETEHGEQGLIEHLNDDHEWPREAIADFVETIERKLMPEPIPEEEEMLCR